MTGDSMMPPQSPVASPEPAATSPMGGGGVIPFTDETRLYWRREIDRARLKRKEIAARYGWDENLKRYEPPAPTSKDINLGVDFADVERKKAALLFDTPSVALQTNRPELAAAVSLHSELLNTLLGPQHVDALPAFQQAIFDCLCPSGVGPVVVGYTCTTQPTQQDVPVMDPMGQPQMNPLTGQPMTQPQMVEMPICEKYYISKISPKALLIPADLKTTLFDAYANWLGWDWRKPVSQVRRDFNLGPDWAPKASDGDKPYFREDEGGSSQDDTAADPAVSGVEIWYHTYLDAQGDTVVHPDRLRRLVLIDNDEQPVVHRDSPHQTVGPDGRLTPDSMIGFPLDPLVLRDLTDSAWVPSDCAMTAMLTREQQKYREITLRKRDNSRDVTLIDAAKINPDVRDKVLAGDVGAFVAVEPGMLDQGINTVMAQATKVSQGRETYLDQDLITRDREKVLGISANQQGANTETKRTATESTLVQRNTDARFEQERKRGMSWILKVVRKLDALVLRYADAPFAQYVLGPQKGQAWFAAKPSLAGCYTYSLQMDSGKYLDVEERRRQILQIWNFAAKAPVFNQVFVAQKVAEAFGWDPQQALVPPQPPKPDPPKMALSAKAEDFVLPQGPILLEILAKMGDPIDPDAVRMAMAMKMLMPPEATGEPATGGPGPAEHGGGADKAERIDQHQIDETGGLSGPGPM